MAGATWQKDHILFGCAYYDEYMPYERLDKDMEMMKAAGINVIRIAESTWSTEEPQPGVFDFSHVDRAIEAAAKAGIDVIIGTPTYAVPSWLVRLDPKVLADTPNGPGKYGPRQIMNIMNGTYRFHAERIIRRLAAHVADRPNVIGWQVDNETKYYDVVSADVQALFVRHVRELFHGDLDAMNREWGLDYWSNRVDAWEDFPDPTNTINASIAGEFDKFRRDLVSEFLAWQASIVREYARDDQFVTQNFDFGWKGGSYGVQPAVDHFGAARALDVAGCDIYFQNQDQLDGAPIAFCTDLTRGLKDGANFLVLETEAQGNLTWLAYPGQLRLQAYSLLAGGADSVMYWHWHSCHNSWETYWKGILSHDFEPGRTYREVAALGAELKEHGVELMHLTKRNDVAVLVSNRSLTGLEQHRLDSGFRWGGSADYNDVVRMCYDALYRANVEADVLDADDSSAVNAERLAGYKLVVIPALYAATDEVVEAVRAYVEAGGHVFATCKSFFCDEQLKVRADRQPHGLTDVFGVHYNEFTRPNKVGLKANGGWAGEDGLPGEAMNFIELLEPAEGTETLATYDHGAWGSWSALTRHGFGAGSAEWLATMVGPEAMDAIMADAVRHAGVGETDTLKLAGTPVRVRRGYNAEGRQVTYLLNYSSEPVTVDSPAAGRSLLGAAGIEPGAEVIAGAPITLDPWGVAIVIGQ